MRLFRRRNPTPISAPPPPQRDPRVGPDPVVDVNVPVTNPALIAAIVAFAGARDEAAEDAMLVEFARATYLAPVTHDRELERGADGRATLTAGTHLGFMYFPDEPDGALFFGVCTDHEALDRCRPPGARSHVLLARTAFTKALQNENSAGLILNPGSVRSLTMNWEKCRRVLQLLGVDLRHRTDLNDPARLGG